MVGYKVSMISAIAHAPSRTVPLHRQLHIPDMIAFRHGQLTVFSLGGSSVAYAARATEMQASKCFNATTAYSLTHCWLRGDRTDVAVVDLRWLRTAYCPS
uniref:Uncharacterized protein n=1 Tax=Bionectria ochroleuca TaxID=29856 RepID=A0A8H7NN71_BIOOC